MIADSMVEDSSLTMEGSKLKVWRGKEEFDERVEWVDEMRNPQRSCQRSYQTPQLPKTRSKKVWAKRRLPEASCTD